MQLIVCLIILKNAVTILPEKRQLEALEFKTKEKQETVVVHTNSISSMTANNIFPDFELNRRTN